MTAKVMKVLIRVLSLSIAIAAQQAGAQTRPGTKEEQERLVRKNAAKLKASLRGSLVRGLNDPESARFRDEFLSWSDGDPPVVSLCGEINAKNRMGGYVGFARYIVNDDGLIVLEAQEGPSFRHVWPVWCGARIRD